MEKKGFKWEEKKWNGDYKFDASSDLLKHLPHEAEYDVLVDRKQMDRVIKDDFFGIKSPFGEKRNLKYKEWQKKHYPESITREERLLDEYKALVKDGKMDKKKMGAPLGWLGMKENISFKEWQSRLAIENLAVKVPGNNSLNFWKETMNKEIAEQWEQTADRGPQCNTYMANVLKTKLGEKVYNKVFPNGMLSTNGIYNQWEGNENLVSIDPDEDYRNLEEIQDLADKGILILMAYHYGVEGHSGHVAFVGNSGLDLFSLNELYPRGIGGFEGLNGSRLEVANSPIMVQAGAFTGIVPMNWASNDWNVPFESERHAYFSTNFERTHKVKFYYVRK